MNGTPPPLLSVEHVYGGYSHVPVVRDVSFSVMPGEYFGIVGSNGAGKSALMLTLAGIRPVLQGRVGFAGDDVSQLSAWKRWAAGIALVPETRELFGSLTVEEHLKSGVAGRRGKAQEAVTFGYELFPVLADLRNRQARQLSGGQQQTLAIARAAVARPGSSSSTSHPSASHRSPSSSSSTPSERCVSWATWRSSSPSSRSRSYAKPASR